MQLNNDYLETVSYDSIILDRIRVINEHLGIDSSVDPREIPLSRFSNPKVLSSLADISKLLALAKGKKDVTNISHLYKFWNGCSIEPVKCKGSKNIKRVIVDGKREKVYQVVGLEGFYKGNQVSAI
jgi:hypothetical protein